VISAVWEWGAGPDPRWVAGLDLMKLAVGVVASLAVLVAAFILLPRLLLDVSSHAHNENVPVGETGSSSAARTAGTPAPGSSARRFVDFAQLQASAGFTPLSPASLPADYQPWEQYVKAENGGNVVVLSFFKPDGLFVQIYERQHAANDRSFFRGGFQPGEGTGRAGGRPPGSPFIDVGGVQGVYAFGTVGPGNRQMIDALGPSSRNTQPHRVLLIKDNLEIIVEADLTDVPRDELIQIAAGLHQ